MMWAATLMVMKIYSDVDVHVLNLLLLPTQLVTAEQVVPAVTSSYRAHTVNYIRTEQGA